MSAGKKHRKSKFQADLAPSEERVLRTLKAELELASNTDLLSDALTLYSWAVGERRRGRRIVSENQAGERNVLVFPRLERVAPGNRLPRVEIEWSSAELETMARLVSAPEPEAPTEALIRALRD